MDNAKGNGMNKVQQQAQDKLVTAIAFLENAQAQGVDAEHEEILSDAFALLRGLQQPADFGDFGFEMVDFSDDGTVWEVCCKGARYGEVRSEYDGGAWIEYVDGTVDDADDNAIVQELISTLHTIERILWDAEFDDIVQTAREAMRVKYSKQ